MQNCRHEILCTVNVSACVNVNKRNFAYFTSNSSGKIGQHSPLTASLGQDGMQDTAILTGSAQLFSS